MKITRVETIPMKAPFRFQEGSQSLIDGHLGPVVTGMDPFDMARIE